MGCGRARWNGSRDGDALARRGAEASSDGDASCMIPFVKRFRCVPFGCRTDLIPLDVVFFLRWGLRKRAGWCLFGWHETLWLPTSVGTVGKK